MKKELAVVLMSGGMDSCVTAAIANKNHRLVFLHLTYGQRTEKRELEAFNSIADHFNVNERLICSVEYLRRIGGSSITDESIEIPPADINNPDIPASYVPFRNTHILSIAVSWGEVIGASKIYIGAVQDDSSGYPDCREEYYKIFNKLIKAGTRPDTRIKVVTPLIHMKKRDIVLKGIELKVPFELTWSCYKNTDIACGNCDSCAFRLRGFKEAGIDDPIKYGSSGNFADRS